MYPLNGLVITNLKPNLKYMVLTGEFTWSQTTKVIIIRVNLHGISPNLVDLMGMMPVATEMLYLLHTMHL